MDVAFIIHLSLVSVWISEQIVSSNSASTISGNGTGSDGSSVLQGDNLKLTCSSSKKDIISVDWYNTLRGNTKYQTTPSVTMFMNSTACTFHPDLQPPASMQCNCVNISTYTCTLISVSADIKGIMWRCKFIYVDTFSYTNNLTIGFTVGITSTAIFSPQDNPVSVIENTAATFKCKASPGNPEANVKWYKNNTSPATLITSGTNTTSSKTDGDLFVTQGTLILQVQRADHDTGVYCRARNLEQWFSSGTTKINVLYGPDSPTCKVVNVNVYPSLRVIIGSQFLISCTADSNPLPNEYILNGPGSKNQQLNFTGVLRTQTGAYTVEARNSMTPTGSSSQHPGKNSTSFAINVLYTPSAPNILMDGRVVQGSVNIIEGTSKAFNCSTDSNPVSNYSWTYPNGSSDDSILQVNNFLPDIDDGDYTCTVRNTLVPSFGRTQNGMNMTTMTVKVLYGPKMRILQDISVVRGEKFEYPCLYEQGSAPAVNFEWTRSKTSRPWIKQENQNLTFSTVQRSDEANYTCNVSSTLQATFATKSLKYDTATFHLNVMYGAENLKILLNNVSQTSVEIEENTTNHLQCSLESDPASNIAILKDGRTKMESHGIHQLTHELRSECSDTGVYTCSGYNKYGAAENTSVHLFVKCSARQPQGAVVKLNYTARHDENVTMSYTIVAYPVPKPEQFDWKRCTNESEGSCYSLLDNMHKFAILTEGLSSFLTIRDVKQEDYGIYQFSVYNDNGSRFTQWLHLKPIEKPDSPTDFHVIQEEISETSAVLTWVPGFDNGSPQTFYITYGKKGDSASRITVSVEHNHEAKINYTLRNLETETEYIASINASNKKGSSTTINDITFITLKHIPGAQTNVPVALIGGAVGGGIVVVLVIIGLIFLVKKMRISGFTKERETVDRRKRQHSSQQQDDDEEVENEMYESAGDFTQRKSNENRSAKKQETAVEDMYAQPNKNKHLDSLNSDVYAVVKKDKKKGTSKTGHYKQEDNHGFGDETYEDHELPVTKKNKNKGGLIYADLEMAKPPKGQKPLVIHGLNDTTVYADVDLTKKADPLPELEEEKSDKKEKK